MFQAAKNRKVRPVACQRAKRAEGSINNLLFQRTACAERLWAVVESSRLSSTMLTHKTFSIISTSRQAGIYVCIMPDFRRRMGCVGRCCGTTSRSLTNGSATLCGYKLRESIDAQASNFAIRRDVMVEAPDACNVCEQSQRVESGRSSWPEPRLHRNKFAENVHSLRELPSFRLSSIRKSASHPTGGPLTVRVLLAAWQQTRPTGTVSRTRTASARCKHQTPASALLAQLPHDKPSPQ